MRAIRTLTSAESTYVVELWVFMINPTHDAHALRSQRTLVGIYRASFVPDSNQKMRSVCRMRRKHDTLRLHGPDLRGMYARGLGVVPGYM